MQVASANHEENIFGLSPIRIFPYKESIIAFNDWLEN